MNKSIFFILIFTIFVKHSYAMENTMILKLKDGDVVIELFKDIAPNHVKRFQNLSKEKKYDGVVFHRVIDGFMAQTGDVQFGNSNLQSYDLKRVGTGGSNYPDLKAEFSELPHERGTLSMARSANPNSANSQFFICFKAAAYLDRQYTVFGKVVEGMEFVDLIKKGQGSNGEVSEPDKIISLSVK
jgi:cyclophilin family peptidyl-prolyl cis-trans isomerase